MSAVTRLARFQIKVLASLVAVAAMAWSPRARAVDDADVCANAALAGQRARDAGTIVSARASFLECARPVCPKPIRVDCTKWVSEVEATLPSVVLGAKDASGADLRGVEVRIDNKVVDSQDGAKAVDVDPGTHLVWFGKSGYRSATMQVIARIGEHNRTILVTLAPGSDGGGAAVVVVPNDGGGSGAGAASERSAFGTPVIALGVVGALGVVSFATFGILGLSERSRVKDACGSTCSDAQVSGIKTRFIVADVSLAVGIVSLGVAAALYFTGNHDAGSTPGAGVNTAGIRFSPRGIEF